MFKFARHSNEAKATRRH